MTTEEAIEFLNIFRNQHYADSTITDEYELAMGLNVILPHYVVLRSQQKPAKLDRSRWEGCEYCKDIPASIRKGFCYACGRPLTEEAWAELERRMSGG